jgi:hypothetical protein
MKAVSRLIAVTALAIVSTPALVHAACSKDADCKGDRICSDEGKCVAPDATPARPQPKAKEKEKAKAKEKEPPPPKPRSRYADDDDDARPAPSRRETGPNREGMFGVTAGVGAPFTIVGAGLTYQWTWWFEVGMTFGYGSSSASGSSDTSVGTVTASATASEWSVMSRFRFWLMHGNHAPIIELGEGTTWYSLDTTARSVGTLDSMTYSRSGSPAFTYLGAGYGYRADGWFRLTATLGVILPDTNLGDSTVTSTGSFTDADRASFRSALDGVTNDFGKAHIYGELAIGAMF